MTVAQTLPISSNDVERATLHVVAAGMCCSVGYTAQAASCALRSGMDHFQESEFVTSSGEPLRVARLPDTLTWGPQRLGQWMAHAVRDCLSQAGHLKDEQLLAILLAAETSRPGAQLGQSADTPASDTQAMNDAFSVPLDPRSQVLRAGRAGLAPVLRRAYELLALGVCRQVLVLGPDYAQPQDVIRHDPAHNPKLIMATRKTAVSNKGAPNTRKHVYIDTAAAKADCAKDTGAIDKNCKPESQDEKNKRKKSQPGPLGKLKSPGQTGKAANPNVQWVNDHCEFLMIKPSSPEEIFKELEKIPEQMAEELGTKALESIEAKVRAKLEEAVAKKAAKVLAKQGLIRVGSLLLTPLGAVIVNVLMTADGINDIADAAKDFPEIAKEIEDATAKLKDARAKIADMQGQLDKYKNADGTYNKQKIVSDMMTGAAKMNPCIRARRCVLVPFNETDSKKAGKDGKGCCPGQSGHHVLPSSMFKGCDAYKEGDAPTVCVEGTNNSHGSHGTVHGKMGVELKKLGRPKGAQIEKKDAIKAGAQSVKEAFPESNCEPKCLEAQLRSFYDGLNCVPKNESGESGGGTTTTPNKTKG